MSKLSIEFKNEDFSYHSSKEAGNNLHGKYVFHNIDLSEIIVINGTELQLNYQAGCSYDYGDYSCHNQRLDLSEEGGTNSKIIELDRLLESDFDDNLELVEEVFHLFNRHNLIKTISQLQQIWQALRDNQKNLGDHLDLDIYDNIDNFVESEDGGGLLTLKNGE